MITNNAANNVLTLLIEGSSNDSLTKNFTDDGAFVNIIFTVDYVVGKSYDVKLKQDTDRKSVINVDGEDLFEDIALVDGKVNCVASVEPSTEPTTQPTQPSDEPTDAPTQPSDKPTDAPTQPSDKPTDAPTQATTTTTTTVQPTTQNTTATTPTTVQPTTQPSTTVPNVCQHDFNKIVVKNAKAETYFATGYTGDKVCSECGEEVIKGSVTNKLTLKTPKFKLKKGKKQFKVKYTKVKDATGFQVRYRIKGKWKVKTYNTKKTVTKTIKKLKKGVSI